MMRGRVRLGRRADAPNVPACWRPDVLMCCHLHVRVRDCVPARTEPVCLRPQERPLCTKAAPRARTS